MPRAEADRIDVPGGDLESVDTAADVATLADLCEPDEKAPAPGAWSEGRPSVCHARDRGEPGQQGETPGISRSELLFRLVAPVAQMNESQVELFVHRFFLGSCEAEGAVGDRRH